MRRRAALLHLAAGLLACAGLAGPARAWGDAGHEIVAAIAYARLTAPARRAVDALLASDTDPLTAPDFASRSLWADRYRDADRDGSRAHYLATRLWHYVDIDLDHPDLDAACRGHPAAPRGAPASAGPAEACIVDKVDQFAAELRDRSLPAAERQLALKFVLHLVGDLHQPLHAADHADHGGNDVAVARPGRDPARPESLHAYWDVGLVERLGSRRAVVAARLNRLIGAAQARAWSSGRPADWALESWAAARTVAYDFGGLRTRGQAIVRLDARYEARALPVVALQLSKAGVRLAALLNAALD